MVHYLVTEDRWKRGRESKQKEKKSEIKIICFLLKTERDIDYTRKSGNHTFYSLHVEPVFLHNTYLCV